ncbi:MAG: sensor histidine kinase [Bacteroidota bacterium]
MLHVLLYTESIWRDVWLIIFSFLLFTGTLYVYLRLRTSTFSRFKELLEERVQVKTRQLVEKTIELEKLSLVASRTDNAVLIAGAAGIIEWVNDGFLARYHRTNDQVLGSKLELLKLYDDVSRRVNDAVTVRHSMIFESYIPDHGVAAKWISTTLTPIYDETSGELRKLLFVDADITSTKLMQQQIQNSLKEKDVLLKEIHHRVKNNLQIIISLLNLQSGYIKDEATLKAVKDGQLRVRSMALVHEKFYQADELLEINFSEYIEKLCHYLYQAYSDKTDRIKIVLHTEPVGLDMDTAMPCGLLVNEIVSNAYKYAFPGQRPGNIDIHFHRLDGIVKLTIKDDGVGLPGGFEIEHTETLGMQLIQALTSQLDGNLTVDRNGGTGFTVSFQYPKAISGNPSAGFSV